MVKRQRSFDGRGGVGWREKYVKEGFKIYVCISNISGKGINKEKKYVEELFPEFTSYSPPAGWL